MKKSARRGRRAVFVDTFWIIAILDPKDAHHDEVLEGTADLDVENVRLVTTDAVLLEVANYFAESALRSHAIDWIAKLRVDAEWEIIPLEKPLLTRGEARYRRYRDKFWSLTDCITMEVMEDLGITDIATADHHFTQAGFRALL